MTKIRLNIGGEKGNAFYLLGLVNTLGRQLDMSTEECADIRDKMTGRMWSAIGGSGTTYNDLIRVFTETFPMVELYAYHKLPIDSSLYVVDNRDTIEL